MQAKGRQNNKLTGAYIYVNKYWINFSSVYMDLIANTGMLPHDVYVFLFAFSADAQINSADPERS